MKILQRSFYTQNTKDVAKKLLGKLIYHKVNGFEMIAKIVETEAYTQNDPACHANRGITPRNKVMFWSGGYVYVYFAYGNHWLLNFVTAKIGVGEAVLIRAVEPIEGISIMRQYRQNVKRDIDLTNGPGKLTQAMAITKDYYGMDLTSRHFHVLDSGERPKQIVVATRIGISDGCELPYRFYIKDNPYVSRR